MLRRFDSTTLAEAGIGERVVADEAHAADRRAAAFVDLEHDVGAVVAERRHDRLDGRLAPALAGVVVDDALDVALQLGVGENAARLGLQELEEDVVLDLLVAADNDRVDDRVLDHGHNEPAAADRNAHVGEQPGAVEGLDRLVDLAAAERLPGLDQHVVADRLRIDARIAGDDDAGDDGGLGRGRCKHHGPRAGNTTGKEDKREGRTPNELPE